MSITADQIVNQTARILRRGRGETESGIFDDWVRTLLPVAVTSLAEKLAEDPMRRGLITKNFAVSLTSGIGALAEADYRQLLTSALKYSECYNATDSDSAALRQQPRLVYKADFGLLQNLKAYLDPAFQYYSFRAGEIITRGLDDTATTLWLYAVYIPNFTTDYPLTYELVNECITEMVVASGLPIPLPQDKQ